MAKKSELAVVAATNTALQMDIVLSPERLAYLASMVTGDTDDTDIRKAQAVILRLVEDQAAGGLMLRASEVKRITDSTGLDPSCGEDLLPFLAAGTGRSEGCRTVTVRVDPAYEPALEDIARVRGAEIDQICRETMEMVFNNSWYEHLIPQPRHVLMTETDQAGLEELLGGKFTTGTELAALIRQSTGAEGGLFSETEAYHAEQAVS